jgi:hypothetical protein
MKLKTIKPITGTISVREFLEGNWQRDARAHAQGKKARKARRDLKK